ncbi:Fatty acid oxidation complex subunit alpha [Planctomycetes bacterium Pan216]|uniref:enoyl-CoA hydratase n=1 Tax=Kolteria novifilia TaxID=2527975 RepID=A0A518B6X2_9BACT|nr:Fatty acid oxidation complex subunit alpha [Planctomycetes bacterium Pan216]
MVSSWTLRRDTDGVRHLVLDVPGRSANALSRTILDELDAVLGELEEDRDAAGLVISSGKPNSFIVGADVDEIRSLAGPEDAREMSRHGQRVFARLESLQFPTVATVSGPCLGGGLELALACDYLLTDEHPKTLLGLPEVKLGLVPGWGGTVRLPKRVGLLKAIEMIPAGRRLNPAQAKKAGLADAVVSSGDDLLDRAKTLLREPPPRSPKPWSRRLLESRLVTPLIFFRAQFVAHAGGGRHYRAPHWAVVTIQRGFHASSDAGFEAENDACAHLAEEPTTRELIRLFVVTEELKRDHRRRIAAAGAKVLERIGIVGAGTMGAKLAIVAVKAGYDVTLQDVSQPQLERAREAFDRWVASERNRGRLAGDVAPRLTISDSIERLVDADLVIEAIVEDLAIKQALLGKLSSLVAPETILATNTSSFRVAEVMGGVEHPERTVGLHFFNPPDKTRLVEVVPAEATSDTTLATGLALAEKVGKTAVVTTDTSGFLANRLFVPYLNETGYLLTELKDPLMLDRTMKRFGFPMGPLRLTQLVGLGVAEKVLASFHEAYGERFAMAPAWKSLLDTGAGKPVASLLDSRERSLSDEAKQVLEGLPGTRSTLSKQEIIDRLTLAIINEAGRCLEEGVVERSDHVDLTMILAAGFPPFRGGPLQYGWSLGWSSVVETLDRLAESRPRYEPCDWLREQVKK